MRVLMALIATLTPSLLAAAPFERPIPQAQSATAEFWFALAALGLALALGGVARVVARR